MKKVILWIYLQFKRQLKSMAVWVLLLALPVSAAVIVAQSANMGDGKTKIALLLTDDDAVAESTVELLVDGDYQVEFYKAENEESLMKDIYEGRAEVGYIITDNLTDKILNKNYKACIKSIINGDNFIASMTNEIVFSALFRNYADKVAIQYIKASSVFADITGKAVEEYKAYYNGYNKSDMTFHLEFKVLSDSESDADELIELSAKENSFPIRGLAGLLVMLAAMLGGVLYLSDKEKGRLLTLPLSCRRIAGFVYPFVAAFSFAVSAEITLLICHTGDFPVEFLRMFGLLILSCLYTFLLTKLLGKSRRMIIAALVIALLSLAVCPVFVDVTSLVKPLKMLSRCIPLYYYCIF